MDWVTSLQRGYNEWLLQKELPKWLTVFFNNRLPWIVALLLMVLIAQLAAEMTWRFIPAPISGASPISDRQPVAVTTNGDQTPDTLAKSIAGLHLFGMAGSKPAMRESVVKKAPETRLNLTLHGVFVAAQPEDGAAIIGTSGSKQKYHKVGSNVMTGVKLQAVYNDRVVLSRKGQSEILKFPQGGGSQGAAAGPAMQKRAARPKGESLARYRDMLRNEPLKIFEHVRFVPVRSGKSIKGYRVLPQRNRKLYNQLGIRPSDLVTAVNGVPLQDDKEALRLVDKLKDADQLYLEIVRRGKPQSLTLSLN